MIPDHHHHTQYLQFTIGAFHDLGNNPILSLMYLSNVGCVVFFFFSLFVFICTYTSLNSSVRPSNTKMPQGQPTGRLRGNPVGLYQPQFPQELCKNPLGEPSQGITHDVLKHALQFSDRNNAICLFKHISASHRKAPITTQGRNYQTRPHLLGKAPINTQGPNYQTGPLLIGKAPITRQGPY